jgi:hypothetical protein
MKKRSYTNTPFFIFYIVAIAFFVIALQGVQQEQNYQADLSCLFQETPSYVDLFSPDDNIRSAFIQLIEQEPLAISIAMYFLVDTAIMKALKNAASKGVHLDIIVDQGCPERSIENLSKFTPLYICSPRKGIMHHKFILFHGLKIIGEGSYNATFSAQFRNRENFSFFAYKQERDIFYPKFQKFSQRFAQLRSESSLYKPSKRSFSEKAEGFALE